MNCKQYTKIVNISILSLIHSKKKCICNYCKKIKKNNRNNKNILSIIKTQNLKFKKNTMYKNYKKCPVIWKYPKI